MTDPNWLLSFRTAPPQSARRCKVTEKLQESKRKSAGGLPLSSRAFEVRAMPWPKRLLGRFNEKNGHFIESFEQSPPGRHLPRVPTKNLL
jgi:hypothetical protein